MRSKLHRELCCAAFLGRLLAIVSTLLSDGIALPHALGLLARKRWFADCSRHGITGV
ncbi:hypothetical protein KCP74_02175 [Salmonella enterica subsp. enterica]|nr:hypothetical protein KCP74_02175 [Salmonella enterica subsp. enterica]